MLYKTKAIVLHHVDYGDSSIIVTLYSEDRGRLVCMINGVRSKKPKFSPTLFQQLTILDLDIYYRPSREIQRVKDVMSPFHYRTIPYNYAKNATALFLAEVLYLVLREEESNPALFAYIFNSLQLFDTGITGMSTFHHWFMIQLTRYLGFFPPKDSIQSFNSGESQPFSGLSESLTSGLKLLTDTVQSPPDLSYLSQQERNKLLESIIRYYSLHIDGFSRLRSFSVLQEVFGQSTH